MGSPSVWRRNMPLKLANWKIAELRDSASLYETLRLRLQGHRDHRWPQWRRLVGAWLIGAKPPACDSTGLTPHFVAEMKPGSTPQ